MQRIRYTTTIQKELLNKAKEKADQEGLEGANAIIEKALRLYFANDAVEVWEKVENGWLQKVVKKGEKIIFQKIKSRKLLSNPEKYSSEALKVHGFQNVWNISPQLSLSDVKG